MTILIVIFTAFLFYFLGQNLPYFLGRVVTKIENERILGRVRPTEVDESLLCVEPHEWIGAPKGIDDNGEFITTNMCKNCGFIPSTNLMASQEGLTRIIDHVNQKAEEEKWGEEFIQQEEDGIKRHFEQELKNGLDFHKLIQVYFAGQTVKERIILFRRLKMAQKTEQLENNNVNRI